MREPEVLALGMSLPGLGERAQAVGSLPSLGLLTLAGMVPAGWTVSYHDAPRATDALLHEVMSTRPTVVGISALTASANEAYGFAAKLRSEGCSVVMGGLHATVCAEEAKGHVDAVVAGDGEPVWHEVLRDAEAGRLRGVYRADRPFDLSKSPQPRLELLGPGKRPRYTVQTARGCPFACEFCGAQRLLGPYREKPVELVARELAAITSMRPKATIELADDNTFAGRGPYTSLLGALRDSGVRWFSECDWRIGERPEIVERLAESGCVQVLIGIEAFTHPYAGMGTKRAPEQRVMDAVACLQDAGVAVIGCFVVGADGDDVESVHALAEWLMDAPFADVQLTVQTPFPGTALRSRLEREGRILPDRGWEACTMFDVAYRPARMSAAELERAFRSAVSMVFAPEPATKRSAIRRRVWGARYGVGP